MKTTPREADDQDDTKVLRLGDLISQLQLIEREYGGNAIVVVDTEARCNKAHLHRVTGAWPPEATISEVLGEDVVTLTLEI